MRRALPLLFALAAAGAELASRVPGEAVVPAASAGVARPDAVAPTVQLTPLAQIPDVTAITNAGDRRVFVTQRGQIVIWDGTQILPAPFLDVSTLIVCCGEQGLLSTAFHPNYALNGFFFVNYTNLTGQTVVARYRVSASDPNQADPFSAVILLTIDQPFTNHNGGQLQFGPDGDLYIGMGDGGSENDPLCNSQSTGTLLGKMLRIDVNQNVDQPPYYAVPADNPYVSDDRAARGLGLRSAKPLEVFFRSHDGRSLHRRRRPGRDGGDRLPYGRESGRTELRLEDHGRDALQFRGPRGLHGDAAALRRSHVHAAGPHVYARLGTLRRDRRVRLPRQRHPRLEGVVPLRRLLLGGDLGGRAAERRLVVGPSRHQPSVADGVRAGRERRDLRRRTGPVRADRSAPRGFSTIASITPQSGPTRGSEGVVILGTNFTSQTGVIFGGIPARAVVVQSSTVLLVEPPPHPAGLVDVTVVNPGAPPATSTLAYGYIASPRSARVIPPPRVVGR